MSLSRLYLAGICMLAATAPALSAGFGFAEFWAAIAIDGSIARASGLASSSKIGTGTYRLVFTRPLDQCMWTTSLRGTASGMITASRPNAAQPSTIVVYTFAANGSASDRNFVVIATCQD